MASIHRTHEQQEQRDRMRQAVLERRQEPLREALGRARTQARSLHRLRAKRCASILKENATNAPRARST